MCATLTHYIPPTRYVPTTTLGLQLTTNGSLMVLQVMSVWCEGKKEDWFCTHRVAAPCNSCSSCIPLLAHFNLCTSASFTNTLCSLLPQSAKYFTASTSQHKLCKDCRVERNFKTCKSHHPATLNCALPPHPLFMSSSPTPSSKRNVAA